MQVYKVNQYIFNEEAILIFPQIDWNKDFSIYFIANTINFEFTYVAQFLRKFNPKLESSNFEKIELVEVIYSKEQAIKELNQIHTNSVRAQLQILKGEYPNRIERSETEIKNNVPQMKIIEEINPKKLLTHQNPHARKLIKELINV